MDHRVSTCLSSMRVIHIITRLILGGAQENTVLTCEDLLHKYGDEVLLVTGPPLGPEGSLVERAKAGGVPIQVVRSLRREINPWYDVHALLALYRLVRQFRPDVVHTHSAKAGILGRAVAWQLKVPVVVHTVHGAPFHPYQSQVARSFAVACERWAARRCHRLISVANAMTELLTQAKVAPPDKFVTIYSGMEVEPFLESPRYRPEMRRRLGYQDEHFVVGTIARLFHLKGHDDLVKAAATLIPRFPQIRFLWVGDGVLRERFEKEIRRAGWSQYFYLAGLVPPDELPRWLSAMDVVVHPSLREGLARVLPQGLLAGKPVISYDVDGAREVVIPEVTGFLVRPRDVAALCGAVERLIRAPELARQMGAAGREFCRERFRHEKMTEQIRKLYLELLRANNNVTSDEVGS